MRAAPSGDRHDASGLRRRSLRGVRDRSPLRRSGRRRARRVPSGERRGPPSGRSGSTASRSRSSATGSRVPPSGVERSAPGATSRRSTAATSSTRSDRRNATERWRVKGSRPPTRSSARASRSSERCAGLVPEMRDLARVVPPGVDVAAFRPRPRVGGAARGRVARLDDDPRHDPRADPHPSTRRWSGRSKRRDAKAIAALFDTYDEDVPEPDAAARLRRLARPGRADRRVSRQADPPEGRRAPPRSPAGPRSRDRGARRGLRVRPRLARGTDDRAASRRPARRRVAARRRRAPGRSVGGARTRRGPRGRRPSPAFSTIDTRRARSRRWTSRWCPRSSRRRSGWSPPRELPPARSRWSPGTQGSRRSRARWRPTSVVRGCSPSSRAKAPSGRLAEGHRSVAFPAGRRTRRASTRRQLVRGDALDVGTDGRRSPRCGRPRCDDRRNRAPQVVSPSSVPSRPLRSASASTTRPSRADRPASRRPLGPAPRPGPPPRTPSPGAVGSCRRG